MADPFRKWAQGDEFSPSAAQLNTWTDAARMVQQVLNRTSPADGQTIQPFTPLRMRNNTGDVIPPLGVVGFSAPMVLPSVSEARFIHDLIVDAHLPSDPLDRFAISLQQVPDGALFVAAIGGVVPCRVTGPGTHAIALDGDMSTLDSGDSGAELIWSEAGSAERFGVVRLGGGGTSPPGGTFVKVYTLAIRGTAATGTISWEARKIEDVMGTPTLVTDSGTWDSDYDGDDILASLVSFDSGVLVIGGDIRWNVVKIKFADPTASLFITATSLTRETHGITPQAEMSWCYENEDAWST